MKKDTVVSIIIPCFNDGEFLLEAISSIDFKEIHFQTQVIVVNDGSTDQATCDIFKNLSESSSGVLVLSKPNGGLSSARNFGIKASDGQFILPLDADDMADSRFINSAVEHLLKTAETDVVFGNRKHFGDEDKIWTSSFNPVDQFYINQLPATAMFRKTAFDKIGGYDETMTLGYEDWEFWIHAMSLGCKFHKLDMVSYHYRIRSKSMVRTITIPNHDSIISYIQRKHIGLLMKNYVNMRNDIHDFKNNYRRLVGALFEVLKNRLLK